MAYLEGMVCLIAKVSKDDLMCFFVWRLWLWLEGHASLLCRDQVVKCSLSRFHCIPTSSQWWQFASMARVLTGKTENGKSRKRWCFQTIGVHHINSWPSDPEVYKQLNNFNSRRINKAPEGLLNRLGSFTFMDPRMMISKGEVTWKSQMMHYRSLGDSFLAGAMVWMTFFIGYLCHEGKRESAHWLSSGAVALVHLLVIAVCLGGNMWCDGTWSKDSWELCHFAWGRGRW